MKGDEVGREEDGLERSIRPDSTFPSSPLLVGRTRSSECRPECVLNGETAPLFRAQSLRDGSDVQVVVGSVGWTVLLTSTRLDRSASLCRRLGHDYTLLE